MSEIAVMGILPVLAKLPTLLARIRQTADAIIEGSPDALVIIDSPDFTHRVARRVRATLPRLPVVNYGSPTVWAWRPGRAKAMRGYVDCVLALLPFEPAAHERLGGPRCVYVGHPLIERLDELRPNTEEAARRAASPPRIVVLPGSRRAETARLMEDFGAALTLVSRNVGAIEAVLPTLPHVEAEVRARAVAWSVTPRIVVGEAEKLAAFRGARAALAKSGTGTLELALAGVPMVGAYKIARRDVLAQILRQTQRLDDPVAQPDSRRARDPGIVAARLHARGAGRRAGAADGRRAGAANTASCPGQARPSDAVRRWKSSERARCRRGPRDDRGPNAVLNFSDCPSACIPASARRCRAGAGGRSSARDRRSFPSIARSSRPCARPRTGP